MEREQIERKLITHLVETMGRHGWKVEYVWDGGERVTCDTTEAVLEAVFSVDDSKIVFQKDHHHCQVLIVLGNDGYDAIADYGYTDEFQQIMIQEVDPFADQLEQEARS